MTLGDGSKITSEHGQENSVATVEGAPQKLPYPKSIFFIISNEFCERFNYYGLKAILGLYFTRKLMFDDDTATVLYHGFNTIVYFMCIFGAAISDSWLGKFKTILYISVVYAVGSFIVAIGAIPILHFPVKVTTFIGLLLIAIGSGGIKPCVAAFGGDQFKLPEQLVQMATFFSIFYFSINAGSLISTFVTPILREDVHCFNENDCYSLAFGVPGVLMIVSIIFFMSGKALYTINPPSGNMLFEVAKCIKNAIITKQREKKTYPCEHWLDYSRAKYGPQLVNDTKVLLKILVLYIPLPLFWALFDQQGSRWTFQATRMTGDIGFYEIKPDQMQVVNPFLILFFIPLYEAVIYPLLAKIGISRPLQKLAIGGLLAAVAFLLSGIVEVQLEKTYPILPAEGQAQFRFINGLPCDFIVQTSIPSQEKFDLKAFDMFVEKYIDVESSRKHTYTLTSANPECPSPITGEIIFNSKTATSAFISGPALNDIFVYTEYPQKDKTPMLRILFSSLADNQARDVKIMNTKDYSHPLYIGKSTDHELFSIVTGDLEIIIDDNFRQTFTLKEGSVSTLIVLEAPDETTTMQIHMVEITEPNSMNILWLVPQYVVMTLGEVMFSVTGLEFSYAHAPKSMKSVLQACWQLTVAFGNIIVTIIAGAKIFESQAHEFFLFAALMVLDMLLFMLLARAYKSVPPTSESAEFGKEKHHMQVNDVVNATLTATKEA